MAIRGLIFDFDGLILDTETPEFTIIQDIYAQYDQTLSIEMWSAALGASLEAFDPIDHLQALVETRLDKAELREAWIQLSRDIIERQSPLPGVTNILDRAVQLGLKIGIASSSPNSWVIPHLKRLGIDHYFQVILTKEQVANIKPNPELFQKAILALGLSPAEAIAFEDSPNGIQAARSAGLFTVAVLNPLTRKLNTTQADLILDQIDQIPLEELIEMLNHR